MRLLRAATREAVTARSVPRLRELESAEADIAASRTDVVGTVRVATFQTAAHTIVLDAIDELTARHPGLAVTLTHLRAEAAIPALIARDFDAVLSEDYPGTARSLHSGVMTIRVATDPLLIAIPAAWPATDLSELANAPWVMEPVGTRARAWSATFCRAAGFEPQVRYETIDVLLQAKIVARGHAAALLPELGYTPSSLIRRVDTGQARTITLSVRTGSETNPAVAALIDVLTDR